MKPQVISTDFRNIQLSYNHGTSFPLSAFERTLINKYRNLHNRASSFDTLISTFKKEAGEFHAQTVEMEMHLLSLDCHFNSVKYLIEDENKLNANPDHFPLFMEEAMEKFDEHNAEFVNFSQKLHTKVVESHNRYLIFLHDFENFESEIENFDIFSSELYDNFNRYEINLDKFDLDMDEFKGILNEQESVFNLMCAYYHSTVHEFNRVVGIYAELLEKIKELRVYLHLGVTFGLN